MTRCVVVQHLEPEKPYLIADALRRHDVQVDVCRVDRGDGVPADMSGLDALVVMGGPMSAASDHGFPSRLAELALLEDALDSELPVLGVCLGAQMLAAASGAAVYRGEAGPEIGWAPVFTTTAAAGDPLFEDAPRSMTVLHWHGETFDLPEGAVHLASSDRYEHQAFRVGEAAWGLQFHIEVDAEAVSAFVQAFGDEAERSGIPPMSIEGEAWSRLADLRPAATEVLDRFALLVRDRAGASGTRNRF
ncbi:MAG: type 1 glutamine amidotransferase [Acidimicrobiales bacterium]